MVNPFYKNQVLDNPQYMNASYEPERQTVKASCICFVFGSSRQIIGWEGGVFGEQDIWAEEADNSTCLDDIFMDYEFPMDNGYWVWEGEIEPVYDDAPYFHGKWRPATKEDMAALIKEAP